MFCKCQIDERPCSSFLYLWHRWRRDLPGVSSGHRRPPWSVFRCPTPRYLTPWDRPCLPRPGCRPLLKKNYSTKKIRSHRQGGGLLLLLLLQHLPVVPRAILFPGRSCWTWLAGNEVSGTRILAAGRLGAHGTSPSESYSARLQTMERERVKRVLIE